jgi:hypothetical protein
MAYSMKKQALMHVLHKLPPISPLYKYIMENKIKRNLSVHLYIYIMAMKIGLWKFTSFDFDNCMEMVFLVCRVENHVIYGAAGESVY